MDASLSAASLDSTSTAPSPPKGDASRPAFTGGPYDPCDDIEHRYPNMHGLERMDHIQRTYQVKRSAPLMIWNEKGEVRVMRSRKFNPRQQKAVAVRYCGLFLRKGLIAAFRGKIFHVAGVDGLTDDVLGGATCIEGIVLAQKHQPGNPNVKYVMANGILDTFEVHNRTPDDVQTWIVRKTNAFHKGSECTVVEVYEQCPLAQAKWKAYADPIHLTKNACPTKGEFTYEKQYGRFVGKHFGHYFKDGNWQFYDNAKSFYNDMVRRELWPSYKHIYEERCNILAPGLSLENVVKTNHDILATLTLTICSSLCIPTPGPFSHPYCYPHSDSSIAQHNSYYYCSYHH